MGHNLFAKAYVEMKKAKYNPDGTPKDRKADNVSAPDSPENVFPVTIDHNVPPSSFGVRDPFFRRTFQ